MARIDELKNRIRRKLSTPDGYSEADANRLYKQGMDMFRDRFLTSYKAAGEPGKPPYIDVGEYAKGRAEVSGALKYYADPINRTNLSPEDRLRGTRAAGRAYQQWYERNVAPRNLLINGQKYASFDAFQKERLGKARQEKINDALDVLKNTDGETYRSTSDPNFKHAELIKTRDTFLKQGRGDSLTARLNSAYRDNLHSRRLAAAQQNRQVQDASGNGKPLGPNLIATDAYGRPIRPANPLKNWKGPLSVKVREQLAVQHAVQDAAWRTADAQWRAENPNLVGRDVASLDRGTFMMSEQARGIEAQHKADQSILRGMNQDLANLTKSIDAANFLKGSGYRYDDKTKQWVNSVS